MTRDGRKAIDQFSVTPVDDGRDKRPKAQGLQEASPCGEERGDQAEHADDHGFAGGAAEDADCQRAHQCDHRRFEDRSCVRQDETDDRVDGLVVDVLNSRDLLAHLVCPRFVSTLPRESRELATRCL